MTGDEHYAEGERILKDAGERDAGLDIAVFLVTHASAHFQAASAYAALEDRRDARRNSALRRAMGPSA